MRNLFIIAICFLSMTMSSQEVEKIKVFSKELSQTREISIYKPLGYEEYVNRYYDVFYVFDAQASALPKYVSAISEILQGDSHKGAIVVGISATYIKNPEYARNHDFLPEDFDVTGKGSYGNQNQFFAYVKNEVIPYVEDNYRIRRHRTAIGHSLGGSFVIHTLLNNPTLFDNYVAVSPNLSYKEERLVKGLENFDFNQLKGTKFIYLSHSEENDEQKWKGWKSANDRAYKVLKAIPKNSNVQALVEQFPNEDHLSNFATSVNSAMRTYFKTVLPQQHDELGEESYSITIRAKVPDENDELYITGNQENIGNWNPGLLKMKKVSAFERELKLSVKDITEFKFTRGSWDSDAWVKSANGFSNFNSVIRPKEGQTYAFEIETYSDRMNN
ncbi:alpha/beta hydrolase-fold protein [Lutimonas zeaxanthinifaciens]|uniref:alpha/beta hydrolase-fold protein n=1 Tax=Lutimonas zeaxanthinifaciens TaxID=3060215 RepID=UPI00265D08D0|nr:alpha/beta hydrolase-fold protein [Lutimonas sp. YSD2104]WKK67036.1 alpha/beta hydrolase-fold protein [Lutimonas sp. YSD2104]